MNQPLPSYPDYKPANLPWLAQVPAHWEINKVKRLFRERSEKDHPDEPLLASTQKQGVVLKTMVGSRTVEASKDFHLLKLVRVGDFVISLRSFEGGIEYAHYQGIISPAYNILTPNKLDNAAYFAHLMKSRPFVESLTLFVTGIREGQNIDYGKFNISFLPVPPLAEQQRIVVFLDAKGRQITKLLRAKRQLIKLLQEQKQALILRAVTKGLDYHGPRKDSGVAWLGEVPMHWETVAISRIAKIGNGSTPSRATPEYWFGGDYPWLNSSHANRDLIDSCDQFVTPKALAECHLPRVPAGSVLVAITGQGKTRGKAALLCMEATINQHVAYITPKQKITPEYLHLVLTAAYSTLRSISEDAGSTKGALTCADLKRFKITFPSIPEQNQLLQAVEKETHLIDETIDRAQREIELIQEYRTRLVADVVTGRVDVRHLTIAATAPLPEEDDLLDEEEVDEDELIEETLETDG